ncbi:MAG: hypothetical protein WCO33_04860 [bacterium]
MFQIQEPGKKFENKTAYMAIKRALKSKYIISLIIFLSIVFFNLGLFISGTNLNPIKSDGVGYYVYLPSIFINQEIDFKKSMQSIVSNEYYYKNLPNDGEWMGIDKLDGGKIINKYPIGVSIMESPFFLTTDAFLKIFHEERDGFNKYYQLSVILSSSFYATLGLIFIFLLLSEMGISKKISIITEAVLVFGTSLLHYFTYDLSFSHIYSFFAIAGALYFLLKILKTNLNKYYLLFGIFSSLIIVTRTMNILFVIILLIVIFTVKKLYLLNYLRKNLKPLLLMFLGLAIFVLPQMIIWYMQSGKFLITSYPGEFFDFSQSHFFEVLFSIRKGLFVWSPLLLLSIPGWIYAARINFTNRILAIFLFLFIVIIGLIFGYWWTWSFGGSFGHRAFVDFYPIFGVGIAFTFNKIFKLSKKAKIIIALLILTLIIINLILMYGYWKAIVPGDMRNGQDVTIFAKYIIDTLKSIYHQIIYK